MFELSRMIVNIKVQSPSGFYSYTIPLKNYNIHTLSGVNPFLRFNSRKKVGVSPVIFLN
jgi:hypothetical protein